MTNVVASFTRLCESYINLAERFQQLDIEHMVLKNKLVPLLKVLKRHRGAIAKLQMEKRVLEDELRKAREACNVLVAERAAFKALEPLLSDKVMRLLAEAEEQMDLVNETVNEIEENAEPDLGIEDKALLAHFCADPDAFITSLTLLSSQQSSQQPIESANGSSNGSVRPSPKPANTQTKLSH